MKIVLTLLAYFIAISAAQGYCPFGDCGEEIPMRDGIWEISYGGNKYYDFSLIASGKNLELNQVTLRNGQASIIRTQPEGSWYYELVDHDQRVLEKQNFHLPTAVSRYGNKQILNLEIPYHRNAWVLTIYDPDGYVRFGPYDVSGLGN